MSEIIKCLGGHHEPQEEAVFHKIVKLMPQAPTMIELGCFWPITRSGCSKRDQGPGSWAWSRTLPISPLAVSNAISTIERSIDQRVRGIGKSGARPFDTETSGLVQIPQLSVQAIMSAHNMPVLNLLHCDVQGAETEVLASCVPLLKRGAIRVCIVSTHHHYISGDALTHQRCLALIKGAGGKILAEHSIAESFSGDGLIAAYFGAEPLYWQEPKITYNRAAESLFRDTLFELAVHQ